MIVTSTHREIKPFNLLRWFSLTALVSILLVTASAAVLLSRFLTDRMIHQDSELTAGFVRSIVATENAYSYFDGSQSANSAQLQAFLDHINRMPDVLRTNVYSADRHMVWSSDQTLIGKHFAGNDELEEALNADLVIHSGIIDPGHLPKSEHQHLASSGRQFVESYVPIFDVHGRQVVGVVEIYKVPNDLFEAIEVGVRLIWFTAGVAGLFLYAALFWVIFRAHRIMETQSDLLIESESLAVVGEMGSAVAHGLRNPLAAIRSSAEISLENELPPDARTSTQEIVRQVDRVEGWVSQLLTYAKPCQADLSPVSLNSVLEESIANFSRELAMRKISVSKKLTHDLPNIRGNSAILCQLVSSLIANAMEAMDSGGKITLSSQLDDKGSVVAEIRDNGPGITPNDMKLIFKPFFTKKPHGMGLGLPLVRRVVERLGGSVELNSVSGKGTAVRLHLPIWK